MTAAPSDFRSRAKRENAASEGEIENAVEAGTDELLLRVSAAFGGQERWADRLRAVAYEMLRFLRENPERARLMVVEVLEAGEGAREIRDRGMMALTELIDLGRTELDDPDSVPRSVAEIVAGTIYNRMHLAVENGVETLDVELVRELMFTAVLPYKGIDAALAELTMPPVGLDPDA